MQHVHNIRFLTLIRKTLVQNGILGYGANPDLHSFALCRKSLITSARFKAGFSRRKLLQSRQACGQPFTANGIALWNIAQHNKYFIALSLVWKTNILTIVGIRRIKTVLWHDVRSKFLKKSSSLVLVLMLVGIFQPLVNLFIDLPGLTASNQCCCNGPGETACQCSAECAMCRDHSDTFSATTAICSFKIPCQDDQDYLITLDVWKCIPLRNQYHRYRAPDAIDIPYLKSFSDQIFSRPFKPPRLISQNVWSAELFARAIFRCLFSLVI